VRDTSLDLLSKYLLITEFQFWRDVVFCLG